MTAGRLNAILPLHFQAVNCSYQQLAAFLIPAARKSDMDEPQSQTNTNQVLYFAPKPEAIEKYARFVCNALAERHGEEYRKTEIVNGFTNFVKVVVRIHAKHLNRQGNNQ